jgi:hypothetical protein
MIRVGSPEDHGLALAAIQIDGGTQSRANVNDQVVNEYAEAIKSGATFPPIVVFYDGKKHWLADGFHRFHAYQKIGREKVAADVRQGTRRDAILHSVGANETHGLRRTRDDKRRAVLTLLNDAEWSAKPETWIAETCRVSRTLVRAVLAERPHLVQKQDRSTVREVTRGGTTYTMQTAGIGSKPVSKENLETEGTTPEPMISKAPEPEIAPEGTTPSRNIVSEILALWAEANAGQRAEVLAAINPSSENTSRPQHEVRPGSTSLGTEQQCDTLGVTAGETATNPVANVGEGANGAIAAASDDPASRDVDGADRQQPAAFGFTGEGDGRDVEAFGGAASVTTNSPSTAPTVEPEATPSPPPASGTHSNPLPVSLTTADKAEASTSSPSASATITSPATLAVADGQPSIPSSDALAAGPGTAPAVFAKSEQAVTQFLNPNCQKPETCKWAHSSASCSKCANDAMKARAAA